MAIKRWFWILFIAGVVRAQHGVFDIIFNCLADIEQCMALPSKTDQPRSVVSCLAQSSLGIGCILSGSFCLKDLVITKNAYHTALEIKGESSSSSLLYLRKYMKHSSGVILLAVGIRALIIGSLFC